MHAVMHRLCRTGSGTNLAPGDGGDLLLDTRAMTRVASEHPTRCVDPIVSVTICRAKRRGVGA
jgi:hypothetical protein